MLGPVTRRDTEDGGPQAGSVDGRSTRWEGHREARRHQLVAAAVKAVDRHGPDASVDEIARVAGVSKPVLYRYFADKDDLHTAVGQWGAGRVLGRLGAALATDGSLKQRVGAAVNAYLEVIEQHPQVFLLLVQHRAHGDTDPLADGKAAVAAALTRVIDEGMRDLGLDTGGAEPWAQGLVGLGLSTGEWWLEGRSMSREVVADYLTDFIWGALVGVGRNHGVRITGS
jgi:AcrR family transcriptional regulator